MLQNLAPAGSFALHLTHLFSAGAAAAGFFSSSFLAAAAGAAGAGFLASSFLGAAAAGFFSSFLGVAAAAAAAAGAALTGTS